MQYENYLARKRARFEGICGHVNIPYGTTLTVQDGFIMWKGQQVCGITSQNAYDYFTQNDDGRGKEMCIRDRPCSMALCSPRAARQTV